MNFGLYIDFTVFTLRKKSKYLLFTDDWLLGSKKNFLSLGAFDSGRAVWKQASDFAASRDAALTPPFVCPDRKAEPAAA